MLYKKFTAILDDLFCATLSKCDGPVLTQSIVVNFDGLLLDTHRMVFFAIPHVPIDLGRGH